jgi:hypothetical protein
MTNRLATPITGYLLVTIAVLWSVPQAAPGAIPGLGVPKSSATSDIGAAPVLPEFNTLAKSQESECAPLSGDNADLGVVAPCATLFGRTYTEWSVRWWQWFLTLTDFPTDQNCGQNQTGPVWFLAAGPSIVTCTLPFGQALFFPIVDVECSDKDIDPLFFRSTTAERRLCAKNFADGIIHLAAKVDGKNVHNPTQYRFPSPEFEVIAPPRNIGGLKPGKAESVADGYYLLLLPLSRGEHTISVKGTFTQDGNGNPFSAGIDTTFKLTVQ